MTGLPSPWTVKLDDGTGTFPYDISAFVRYVEPQSWTRGRQDQLTALQPGVLSLTLDNTDGRFTLGNGTYNVVPDQRIRYAVNSVTRFTGYVQEWPVTWPDGSDQFSTVTIAVVDVLAQLGSGRVKLRSGVEQEILQDSPDRYYTLGDPQGATTAADSSGNLQAGAAQATGSGTAIVFGNATGLGVDGLTAATFANGQFLTVSIPVGSTLVAVECWANTTLSNSLRQDLFAYDNNGPLVSDQLGFIQGVLGGGTSPAGFPNDGTWHHCLYAPAVGFYFDGVLKSGTTTNPNIQTLYIGGTPAGYSPNQNWTGSIAHVAVYLTTAPNATRVAAHYASRLGGNGETPAARIARIAGYVNVGTGSLDSAGSTALGNDKLSGRDPATVLQAIGDAALGVVYIDANGTISSINGYTLAAATTPDLTIDADYVDQGQVIPVDMTQVTNYSVGSNTGTSNTCLVLNAASIAAHRIYETDYTWEVNSDAQMVDRTNWRVGNYATPKARVAALKIDLLSSSGSQLTNALALDVGKYIRVTGMPSQTPGGTQLDLVIEGITETISATEWSLTLLCTQKTLVTGWILDSSTYSVLGSTTKLFAA